MLKLLSKTWFCCAVIGLFTVLIWGTTIGFDFVWDDSIYITQNSSLRSLSNIPGFFYRNELQTAEKPSLSYRPIRNVVHALLFAAGGKPEPRPWIFHLANVVCQAIVAMLLFLVVLRLEGGDSFASRVMSLLIALGFVAHPVISEVVCWCKCLDDLLAAAFVLAAARSLLQGREGGRGMVWASVWFALAVFSKESAVPFAFAAILILRGFHKFSWRTSVARTMPLFGVAIVYLTCRQFVLGRTSQCPPLSGSYGQTLIDMFPIAPKYLRLFWGIPPFTVDYNFMVGAPPHGIFSGSVLAGVFLIVAFLVAAGWCWRREAWRVAGFGILWMALFLLPVSNLVPMMQYMAERFLYLPLMGFLLTLGAVAWRFPRPKLVATGAVALIALWAACSYERLGVWHDEVKLFVQTTLSNPENWRPRENAVVAIFALPQVSPFFRLDPDTHQLMALAPPRDGNAPAMLNALTGAHNIFPKEHRFSAALGVAYAQRGQMSNAVTWLELAAHQNTNDVSCWIDLASAYARLSNWANARGALETALRISPTNRLARDRLRELKN